jgi:superfamily II DNA or RNA helicase
MPQHSIILRDYQSDIIARTRAAMRAGCRTPLIVAPTGSGKRVLAIFMLDEAAKRGIPSWFINHRRELIRQSSTAMTEMGVKHGIVSAGFEYSPSPLIQVCAVQTLARRLAKLRPPKLIVWDEVHHLPAQSWAAIYRAVPDAYHIGLSASPQRLDGAGLRDFFSEMIVGPSVKELIAQGYLAPYRLYAPARPTLDGVHAKMGDYVKDELVGAMDKPSVTGDAIVHYQRLAAGKQAMVRAVSIQHSQHITEQFSLAGVRAEHVDGHTEAIERDAIFARFVSRETTVLSQVEIAGEGLDIQGIECAIDLRPTQSLTMALQFWGRALRPAPGKVAILLDHSGNVFRHGLPDEERNWSLDGRPKQERKAAEAAEWVRTCAYCFAAMPTEATECAYCGQPLPVKPRTIKEREGELQEIKELQRIEARRTQGRAKDMTALIELGRSRGYKNPSYWAMRVIQGRGR